MTPEQTRQLVVGTRIPRDFFITQGHGESDITIHAGSYHLALKAAGVECYNHMTYSSILPGIAQEVPKPNNYIHGSVLEAITAVVHAKRDKGETRATAGMIYGWLVDRKTEQKYGGLVCEYNGHDTPEDAEKSLRASLNELYVNGFEDHFVLARPRLMLESFEPTKRFGTAMVMMGFVNYVVPVLEKP